jgi:hypothetical protein
MNSTTISLSPERGCGRRKRGAVYAELLLGPNGRPLEDFLFDPPQLLPLAELGITPRGVKLITTPDGVTHIYDWVGERYYPHVADFLEEVRRLGMSRRLPVNIAYQHLDSRSRIVLVHPRAWIENAADYFAAMGEPWPPTAWRCPKALPEHVRPGQPPEMCAGLWWWDVALDEPIPGQPPVGEFVLGWRRMPAFRYVARGCAALKPRYRPAAFAALPITRLAVIAGGEEETERALNAARKSALPVEVLDE